jgi:predicted dienelactone hydrolase
MAKEGSAEATIRDIKRKTRRKYNAEEKIRIVIEGLRGEETIAELCRREGIAVTLNAAGGLMEGMIDLDRVAVVGYSLGGETALAIAGGRLDLSGLKSVCSTYPSFQWMCTYINQRDLAHLAGLDEVPQGIWPSWSDPRVDSIVALSP